MNTTVRATDLPKPLDVGNGLVVASFARDGSWLSVGRPHPRHGFVELSGLPAFDERRRGDPFAARRYRAWMADERFALLRLELPAEADAARQAGIADDRPVWFRLGDGWRCSSTAWARPCGSVVVQRHIIEWDGTTGAAAVLRFRGGLARSAMAETTEVSPPPRIHTVTRVRTDGACLRLRTPALDTGAVITVSSRPRRPCRWWADPRGGAHLSFGPDTDRPTRTVLFVSVVLAAGVPGVAAAWEPV